MSNQSALYVKINESVVGPSPHSNNKWFFSNALELIEVSLAPSENLSCNEAFLRILSFSNKITYLIFSDIPFPTISLGDWYKLKSNFVIGLVVADSIQFFQNYYEYYCQFLHFAICLGEDDCNYYESSRIPTFYSPLLHENINLFQNHSNKLLKISERNIDLVHIGRLDRGNRPYFVNVLRNLPINFLYFGKNIKGDELSPISDVIKATKNSKLGICFTEPNHERSYSTSRNLWTNRVHNKSSFTQLLVSGCVVISEFQPFIIRNFIPGVHYIPLEKNLKNQITNLLSNESYLQIIQNNVQSLLKTKFDVDAESNRFNIFLKAVLDSKNFNKNKYTVNFEFKYNFIAFNRHHIMSNLYRNKLINSGDFSNFIILFVLLLYCIKKILHKFKTLLHKAFTFLS